MKKCVLYAKLEKYIYVSLHPSTLTYYKYGSFLNITIFIKFIFYIVQYI